MTTIFRLNVLVVALLIALDASVLAVFISIFRFSSCMYPVTEGCRRKEDGGALLVGWLYNIAVV